MTTKRKQELGDCYESAAKNIMKIGANKSGEHFRLIHAEVAGQGRLEGVTYGHAFLLDTKNNMIVDTSNGRDLHLPKSLYYALGCIDEIGNIYEYTHLETLNNLVKFKHYGPWELITKSGY